VDQQRRAVWKIRQMGGTVVTHPGGPSWLRQRIGEEWMPVFDVVDRIELRGPKWTDAAMAELSGVASLQSLVLRDAPLTDAGLATLKGLENLQSLTLTRTQVTNEGLADLRRALPDLTVERGS
jgi:hypothetical protein